VPKHHEIEAAMEIREEQIVENLPKLDTVETPVAFLEGPGQGHVSQDILDDMNKLLSTGLFHVYVKVGHVTVKVRALYLNEHDHNYVDLMVADELEAIKISMLWSVGLVAYVGPRRWLW